MEVLHAKQHLTKVGSTASCASWDLRECGVTAQSKPRWEDFCATLVHTSSSREQFPNSSRGMSTSVRKQSSTQRSDGPRPCTPQLLTSPFVVRMPHVTEAASRHPHKRYGPQETPIAFSTYGRLGREGRNAMEALVGEARWNSDDPSNQRSQVAKWRNTLEQSLLHAQADVLLLSLGAEGDSAPRPHTRTSYPTSRWRRSKRTASSQKPDAMHFQHREGQARRKTWRWQRTICTNPLPKTKRCRIPSATCSTTLTRTSPRHLPPLSTMSPTSSHARARATAKATGRACQLPWPALEERGHFSLVFSFLYPF